MAIVLANERTIPTDYPFYAKLGLSNVIILFGIYIMGGKSAFMLMLLKVFLLSLMFTGLFSTTMMVSLGGGFLSYVVMTVLSKLPGVTVVSVSVMGAVAHNVGQTLTSCVILGTYQLLYTYLPGDSDLCGGQGADRACGPAGDRRSEATGV